MCLLTMLSTIGLVLIALITFSSSSLLFVRTKTITSLSPVTS